MWGGVYLPLKRGDFLLKKKRSVMDFFSGFIGLFYTSVFQLVLVVFVLFFIGYYYLRPKYFAPREKKEEPLFKLSNIIEHEAEGPFLYDRVANLFKMRFSAEEFKLKSISPTHRDRHTLLGFHDTMRGQYLIFCEDESFPDPVSVSRQREVFQYLKDASEGYWEEPTPVKGRWQPQFYYIIKGGTFEPDPNSPLFCFNEDDCLKFLVQDAFKRYFRHLSSKFTQPLEENYDRALSETFIPPLFNDLPLTSYLDAWLTENNRKHIVITADYGMGKTSFVNYYASQLGNRVLQALSGTMIDYDKITRFPVVISLKNVISDGLRAHVAYSVSQNIGLPLQLFDRLVQRGLIVFLLDGFDEMGFIENNIQNYFKSFDEIWKTLATSNNKIVLTGRPKYFENTTLEQQVLRYTSHSSAPWAEKIELSPLSEQQVADYMEKWYPEKAAEYLPVIENNPSLKSMAVRPYLCSIIANEIDELSRQREQDSWTEADLIKRYMTKWMHRQINKQIKNTTYNLSDIEKEELIWAFSKELATYCYVSDTMELSMDTLDRFAGDFVKKRHLNLTSPEQNSLKKELRVGYFLNRYDNHWTFVLKVFYEYLVAEKIMDLLLDRRGGLKHKVLSKPWNNEISDFIQGMIPAPYKEQEKECDIPAILIMLNKKTDPATKRAYHFYLGRFGTYYGLAINIFILVILWSYLYGLSGYFVYLNDYQRNIFLVALPSAFFCILFTYITYLKLRFDRPDNIIATAFSWKPYHFEYMSEHTLEGGLLAIVVSFFATGISVNYFSPGETFVNRYVMVPLVFILAGLVYYIIWRTGQKKKTEDEQLGNMVLGVFLVALFASYYAVKGWNQIAQYNTQTGHGTVVRKQEHFSRGGVNYYVHIKDILQVDTFEYYIKSRKEFEAVQLNDTVLLRHSNGFLGLPIIEPIFPDND